MKIILILILLAVGVQSYTGSGCRWSYKCCKLVEGSCELMCEPEIDCPEETTTEPSPFAPAQALNVRCKFGYKSDVRNHCRKILK